MRIIALGLVCIQHGGASSTGCTQGVDGIYGLQVALQNFPANDSEPSGRASSVPSQGMSLHHQVRYKPSHMPVHAL